ncbi:hypothetical protein EV177_010736, partial [Coemansia sp. RSA 1804]
MSEQEQSGGGVLAPTVNGQQSVAGDQSSSDVQQPTLANGLTQAQQDSVDRARAYAQELQQTVFKEILEAERKRKEEETKPPPGTVNPGLLGGRMDPRNASVMSRIY